MSHALFIVLLDAGAQNLVPNPSFEELDTCPNTFGFQSGDRPVGWYSWYNSPDYFNACAGSLNGIDTLVSVPVNGWTEQYAWDGQAYVGGVTFWGGEDYREYVGAQLVEPLQTGCTYMLRFRTNPAFNGTYWMNEGGGVCNNVGMLFTMGSNAWTAQIAWPPGPDFPVRNYAHLSTADPITDHENWTLVEGIFTADSAYAYVVLGNFFSDALTSGYPNEGSSTALSYHLFDGIEVVPLDGCHEVGLQQLHPSSEPTLTLDGDRLHVLWPGVSFEGSILDPIGRQVTIAQQAQEDLILPIRKSAGTYLFIATAKDKRFVKKFVILE